MTGRNHSVRDKDRTLDFVGELLGSSSSASAGKRHWAELSIFRTDGQGRYIVAGIGRTAVDGEHDRYWASVCDTPSGVVEALHLQDGDGIWYLTNIARRLLHDAGVKDPQLQEAYTRTTID